MYTAYWECGLYVSRLVRELPPRENSPAVPLRAISAIPRGSYDNYKREHVVSSDTRGSERITGDFHFDRIIALTVRRTV